MRSRPQVTATLCIVLLLTAGCSQSQKSDNQQTTTATTTTPGATTTDTLADVNATRNRKIELRDDRLTLGQARDRYKALYRLKPDRQFLLAIANIHHFLTQQPLQEVESSFSDNY